MEATIINVGYGDAILVDSGEKRLLLDGGSALKTEFAGDPYRIPAAEYLAQGEIRHLDAVVISHIHEDHVCGLEAVLAQTAVDRLYVPYPTEPFLQGAELTAAPGAPRSVPLYTAALNAYRRILLSARERNIPVTVLKAGDALDLGQGAEMRVLAPGDGPVAAYMETVERAYRLAGDPAVVTDCLAALDGASNHTSMLLRFAQGETVFLSAADSCPSCWTEVPKNLLENVNVLKLPHHGQVDSISEQFMGNMPLRVVITTSASDRRYNSANAQVYQRLAQWRAPEPPQFLFSDEREYLPWFSRPEGFQAIKLVMNSGEITPEFIKIQRKKENFR